ncbi:MAG TPA: AbrB/MazE/SpoVT family DNA-binding domain-containing protein [Phycisphaerae bacterium]|jgi:antitoxin MazE
MTATTMIQQWGNSKAVRIPKKLASELGLSIGQRVELANSNGQLVIRPARRRSRYKLSELLKGCKGKPHPAIWSKPVGRELI